MSIDTGQEATIRVDRKDGEVIRVTWSVKFFSEKTGFPTTLDVKVFGDELEIFQRVCGLENPPSNRRLEYELKDIDSLTDMLDLCRKIDRGFLHGLYHTSTH